MNGNLLHGVVTKITLFKVGRRGCWFLSLCEDFTVWCPAICRVRLVCRSKRNFFFWSVAVSNKGCNCGPCVHCDNWRAGLTIRSCTYLISYYYLAISNVWSVQLKVPLQAWTGPEGSRKLRFPDFVTTAQDDGKIVSLTHRPPLPPRKCSWYSFLLEAESTPGP